MSTGSDNGGTEAVEPQLLRLIKARLSKRWYCEKIKRSPYSGMAGLFGGDRSSSDSDQWFRMYLRNRLDRTRVMILTYDPAVSAHKVIPKLTEAKIVPFTAAIKQKKKKKFYFNLARLEAQTFEELMKAEESAVTQIAQRKPAAPEEIVVKTV